MPDKATRPYTYEELAEAMAKYKFHADAEAEWLRQRDAAQAIVNSHQKSLDQAREATEAARAVVRKVLGNLEKV